MSKFTFILSQIIVVSLAVGLLLNAILRGLGAAYALNYRSDNFSLIVHVVIVFIVVGLAIGAILVKNNQVILTLISFAVVVAGQLMTHLYENKKHAISIEENLSKKNKAEADFSKFKAEFTRTEIWDSVLKSILFLDSESQMLVRIDLEDRGYSTFCVGKVIGGELKIPEDEISGSIEFFQKYVSEKNVPVTDVYKFVAVSKEEFNQWKCPEM